MAEEWQQQKQVVPTESQNATVTDVIEASNNSNSGKQTGFMTFILDTTGGVQGTVQDQQDISYSQQGEGISIGQTTSSDLISDTCGIHASLIWSPLPLSPGSNSTVRINYTDAFSGGTLDANGMYDMLILDDNGTLVIAKEGLLAENSTDTQTLSFPAEGRYQLELHINGLMIAEQDMPDLTRNGTARGYVFVPAGPIGNTTSLA